MAKQITLSYKGKEYTLEYNRRSVKRMESSGFTLDTEKPMNMITDLFKGAFLMHHRGIDSELVQEIWDAQNHREELLTALVQMYSEPISALLGDEEDKEENPTWTLT